MEAVLFVIFLWYAINAHRTARAADKQQELLSKIEEHLDYIKWDMNRLQR